MVRLGFQPDNYSHKCNLKIDIPSLKNIKKNFLQFFVKGIMDLFLIVLFK